MKREQLTVMGRATVLGAALMWATAAAAVTVHTWVDADGVRHYADAPPADDAHTETREITLDVGAALAPGDADYYSISKQWQRLRDEREAQNAAELERRSIDAAASEAATPAWPEEAPHSLYAPDYYPLPPRYGPLYPQAGGVSGPPSPRNAKVNAPPPVWPRER